MKALVAYFSATGVTAQAAKTLAGAIGADLYEIKPAIPYSAADLNWMDKGSRSSVEMRDARSRPALAAADAPVAGVRCDLPGLPRMVVRGPHHCQHLPRGLRLYRQDHRSLCHLRGSGLGKSAAGLRASAPGAKIMDGRLLNGRLNEAELKAWVQGLKL